MLDIAYIRQNRETVAAAAANKNIEVDIDKLLELDERRRQLQEQLDDVRRRRNEHAAKIKDQGQPQAEDIKAGKELKAEASALESDLEPVQTEFMALLKQVPNIPSADTPIGSSESENQVEYEWGERTEFDFATKNHWELAEKHGWIDKERAAKVTGARFAYLSGPLVELQLALMQFVINHLGDREVIAGIIKEFELPGNLTDKPFTPLLPPLMIRGDVFDAMDRLEPKADRYKIDGEDLWLQGSAEHVMGSAHMDEIIDENQLPIRYVGYATSFRKEAGSYGKDLEGIIRMHQFDKLEMEIISSPQTGADEHLLTIAVQEYLLRRLELPYRKLLKCTADIGKPNARGVDMEVWLPGQGQYRETHTADFMTDYQARRLNTKVRRDDGELEFVHTIDATAFALGRTIVAIVENYQTAAGGVRVPTALKQYINREEL